MLTNLDPDTRLPFILKVRNLNKIEQAKREKQHSHLKMGSFDLGEVPCIIAIVEKALSLKNLDELRSKGIGLLELRIDSFNIPFPEIIDFARLAHSRGFGILGTIRLPSQKFEKNEKLKGTLLYKEERERLGLFEQILPYVDAIDIELETESEYKQALLALARKKKRLVLLSTHNFSHTPETSQMQRVLQEAQSYKVNFIKLAYYAKEQQDLERLFYFASEYHAKREEGQPYLIWIAMGPWGLLSRVLAFFVGSLFSYAFIDRANAPGQFSVDQLHQEFLRYHPGYRKYIDTLKGS